MLTFPSGTIARPEPLKDPNDIDGVALPAIQFVQTSYGKTGYRLTGKESSELVVLVHGISTPSHKAWGKAARALAEKGLRVLTYDLPGRGTSDAPDDAYSESFFVGHLAQLLFALKLGTEPFHLCGLSLGGGIVTTFAATYPQHIKSLALFAPVGALQVPLPPPAKVLHVPGLGELLMKVLGLRMLLSKVHSAYPRGTEDPRAAAVTAVLEDQAREHPGYLRAMLSTLRHFPLQGLLPYYEAVSVQSFPKLVVWGDKDTIVPYAGLAEVQKMFGQDLAHYVIVKDEGHDVTNREDNIATLLEFITAQSRRYKAE